MLFLCTVVAFGFASLVALGKGLLVRWLGYLLHF